MLFQQKVNSRHKNILEKAKCLKLLEIIFMLSFIENSALTGVKHNLKSKTSFRKFEKGYDHHVWKLNLRWARYRTCIEQFCSE